MLFEIFNGKFTCMIGILGSRLSVHGSHRKKHFQNGSQKILKKR